MKDPRLADIWSVCSLKKWRSSTTQDVVILSYPDDEGVRWNKGRPGANQGPKRILYYLGRLVHRAAFLGTVKVIQDFPKKLSLAKRHDWAHEQVHKFLSEGVRVITLGGGHDYGYPDARAYKQVSGGRVINVDAHLDMRPMIPKKINSGTAFRRFLDEFSGDDLVTWGTQPQANPDEMLAYAQSKTTKIFSYRDPMPKLEGPVGLSICLDAFVGIRGVSAPAIMGLSTEQAAECVEFYRSRSRWLGLYESAPKYDPLNEDSARLAAILAHRFIYG